MSIRRILRRVELRDYPTPVRITINWPWYGTCSRCLTNGVRLGDVIVRIRGAGWNSWYHDACFRVVRPSYYQSLPEPEPRPVAGTPAA
jgi:hypothetical protein